MHKIKIGMADAGLQASAAPAPPVPLALQQPVQQVQQIPHLNWSHLNQNFQENQRKMQKHTCSE